MVAAAARHWLRLCQAREQQEFKQSNRKRLEQASETRMRLLLLVWALAGLLPVGCEPISEAQRLYCGQCAFECQQLSQTSPDDQLRATGTTLGHQKRADREPRNNNDAHFGQETHLSEAFSAGLKCSCRTVFDLKRRALVCKNTSSAQKLDRDGQWRLEAVARSRSVSTSSKSGN